MYQYGNVPHGKMTHGSHPIRETDDRETGTNESHDFSKRGHEYRKSITGRGDGSSETVRRTQSETQSY